MVTVADAMLLTQGGPYGGTKIPLSRGVTTIGRAPFNDVLLDDVGVSQQHARVQSDSAGYWIIDSGSANGTFVNWERVSDGPRLLRHLDRIEIGGTGANVHWVFIHQVGVNTEGNTEETNFSDDYE